MPAEMSIEFCFQVLIGIKKDFDRLMKEWTNRNFVIISPTPTDRCQCEGMHVSAYLTIKYPPVKWQTDFYQTMLLSHWYRPVWQCCRIGDSVKCISYTAYAILVRGALRCPIPTSGVPQRLLMWGMSVRNSYVGSDADPFRRPRTAVTAVCPVATNRMLVKGEGNAIPVTGRRGSHSF
jgi:hypothetical protein